MSDPSVNVSQTVSAPTILSSPATAVDVRTEPDGSLVVQPQGALDAGRAVQFRQLLVHAVRKVRPLRLVVDLSDVGLVDPINLGTLAALCDLADDHRVVVFLAEPSAQVRADLIAAGVPPQRIRRFGEAGLRFSREAAEPAL